MKFKWYCTLSVRFCGRYNSATCKKKVTHYCTSSLYTWAVLHTCARGIF